MMTFICAVRGYRMMYDVRHRGALLKAHRKRLRDSIYWYSQIYIRTLQYE